MIAKRTFQSPGLKGLQVLADDGVTNSDQDLNFWYEEVADGLLGKGAAINNGASGERFFVCSFDGAALTPCGTKPDQKVAGTPSAKGGTKRYAVASRLPEGLHWFEVRAASRRFGAIVDCGAKDPDHADTTELCGPATRFDFEIDVTLPEVRLVNHWAPATPQAIKAWDYSDYLKVMVGSYDKGLEGLSAVTSVHFLAEYKSVNEGNIARFECQLDGGTVQDCNAWAGAKGNDPAHTGFLLEGQAGVVFYRDISNNGTARPVQGSTVGPRTSQHSLKIRAVDAAGNVGEFQDPALAWVIDQDPALTRIDRRKLFDSGTRRTTEDKATFVFGSGNGALFYECSVECLGNVAECDQPGSFLPCVSPFTVVLDADLLAKSARKYFFTVRGTDAANNVASCSKPVDVLTTELAVECPSYTWTVDTSTPSTGLKVNTQEKGGLAAGGKYVAAADVTCTYRKEGLCLVNSPAIGFQIESSTPASESEYSCQLDSPVWFACGVGGDTRPGSSTRLLQYRSPRTDLRRGQEIFAKLADGAHYFKVRTTNAHKTTSDPVVFNWYSDTTPPGTVFTETPPTLTRARQASFAFDLFPNENGVDFYCSLDGGDFGLCNQRSFVIAHGGSGVGGQTTTTTPGSSGGGGGGGGGGWTGWLDRDRPRDIGVRGGDDQEVSTCPIGSATPGEFPWAIECRATKCTADGKSCQTLPWDQEGQVLSSPCTLRGGLHCRHRDQPDGRLCLNYQVRLRCTFDGWRVTHESVVLRFTHTLRDVRVWRSSQTQERHKFLKRKNKLRGFPPYAFARCGCGAGSHRGGPTRSRCCWATWSTSTSSTSTAGSRRAARTGPRRPRSTSQKRSRHWRCTPKTTATARSPAS